MLRRLLSSIPMMNFTLEAQIISLLELSKGYNLDLGATFGFIVHANEAAKCLIPRRELKISDRKIKKYQTALDNLVNWESVERVNPEMPEREIVVHDPQYRSYKLKK